MLVVLDEICARIIGLSEGGNIGIQIATNTGVFVATVKRLVNFF